MFDFFSSWQHGERSQGRNSSRTMEEHCLVTCFPRGSFSLLSHTSQGYFCRGGTSHSGPSPSISIISQENASQAFLKAMLIGRVSTAVPSSQMPLACVRDSKAKPTYRERRLEALWVGTYEALFKHLKYAVGWWSQLLCKPRLTKLKKKVKT